MQLNLIPTLCQKLGRSPRTTALMEALRQPLPRLWEAQAEQESLAEQNERDLLLDEVGRCDARPRPPLLTPRSCPQEIEELEEETAHFATELASSFVPFAEEEQEEQKNWKLPSVPAGLAKVVLSASPVCRQTAQSPERWCRNWRSTFDTGPAL